MSSVHADIAYFNARIYNNTDEFIASDYKAQLNQPFISKASDYQGAIIKFNIPGYTIPIFEFKLLDEEKDPTEGIYGIALSYDDGKGTNTIVSQNLTYVSHNLTNFPETAKWVYSYQQMVDMINTALATAFATLVTDTGISTPTAAPWMEYDSKTELFTMYAEKDFAGTSTPQNPVYIWFNANLFKIFPSFNWNNNMGPGATSASNNTDFRLVVQNNGSNLNTSKMNPSGTTLSNVYGMVQEWTSLYAWNTFTQLRIVSFNLPATNEAAPALDDNGNFSTIPMITDFDLPSTEGPDARGQLQYAASGPWRFFELNGVQPITQINLNVEFVDNEGISHKLYILPGTAITIKLAFRKRTSGVGN